MSLSLLCLISDRKKYRYGTWHPGDMEDKEKEQSKAGLQFWRKHLGLVYYMFGLKVWCLFLSQTFFPSGYLIPLTHCTHGNKAECSNKEKAGMCSLQHTAYSSPITGECPGKQAQGRWLKGLGPVFLIPFNT